MQVQSKLQLRENVPSNLTVEDKRVTALHLEKELYLPTT